MRLVPLLIVATIFGVEVGACVSEPWGTYNHGTYEERVRFIYGGFFGGLGALAVVMLGDVVAQYRRRRKK